MELTLHHPMKISPRLLPAVQIGPAWISIEPGGVEPGGRLQWLWHIDSPAASQSGGELSTAPQHTDNEEGYRQALGALLAFLQHAAECYRHDSDYDDPSFYTSVVHWAYQNDDELGMLQVELEEGGL